MLCMVSLTSWSYDALVDGIYYNLNKEEKTAEVTSRTGLSTSHSYSGTIVIPEHITVDAIEYSVTAIGSQPFRECANLTSITIPNSILTIGGSAFMDCTGLTSVTIPNSVTSIESRAFEGCIALTSVSIGNSVVRIDENVFSRCTNLPVVDNLRYADTYLVEAVDKKLSTYNIKNSTKFLGSYAFDKCDNMMSIIIPNSVMSIGSGAFNRCTGLTSVTIPNSVTSIGSSAFEGCSGLTSITISEGVESIGYSAFSGCSGLTSITIPSSIKSIKSKAFRCCSDLASLIVAADNPYYCSEDNILYSKNKSTLLYCVPSRKGSFKIQNTVTSIGTSAFSDCKGLTYIDIPNSVRSIGDAAFYNCPGLTSVTIPNSVTSIGGSAFSECSGLTSVKLPGSITFIDNHTFYGCKKLTSIDIPESVTKIGMYAFAYCNSLSSISIPSLLSSFGEYAFHGCDNINTVYWNSSLSNLPFSSGKVTNIYVGEDVEVIFTPFSDCSKLNKVVLGKNVKYIRAGAFINSKSIKEFYVTSDEPPYMYPNVFAEDYLSGSTLYVPEDDLTYYQSTTPWSLFGNILGIKSTNIQNIETKKAVLLKSYGNSITISGTEKKEVIKLYTVDGQLQDTVVANGSEASIGKELTKGNVYVVKIGEKSIKYKF